MLVTMVGQDTPALMKARSGAHRAELVDILLVFGPVHSQYQAPEIGDLDELKLLQKLRSA